VFQRLKLLRRLQEVTLSPDEAWALFERVKTHTSSAAEREQLAHLMRVTLEVTEQRRADPDVQTPPALRGLRPSPKRSAPVRWPRLPGGTTVVHAQRAKESVVQKPADYVTLSADEGEALIAPTPSLFARGNPILCRIGRLLGAWRPPLIRMLLRAVGVQALPPGAHGRTRRGGSVVGLCHTTSSSLAQAPQD
jgi:hypothetical protein